MGSPRPVLGIAWGRSYTAENVREAGGDMSDDHHHEVPSDPALQVKALESLLVE